MMINTDAIRAACDAIDAQTTIIRDAIATPDPAPPDGGTVESGDDLQAALDAGGVVVLAAGATFTAPGGYTLAVPETLLAGDSGNVITGGSAPAISVPPHTHAVALGRLEPTTGAEIAVLIGRNDTQQTTIESAPDGVQIMQLVSHGHRGKRVIEVNARNVVIADPDIRDAYDPEAQECQGIWIGNAPGPVLVDGGHVEGASEVILVGGDTMKIPQCRPSRITIRDVVLTRPLAWKDAGFPKVKNLLELKDGHDVLIERCTLSHCWKSGQDGYAFMFTPTRGGSLQGVIVRDCTVRGVGGIVNITGIDDAATTPPPRTQIEFYGGDYRTDPAMGGSGRFCLIGRGPEWLVVDGAFIQHHGSAFIDCSDHAPIDLLRVVGCTWNYGSYGIRIGGQNHGDNSLGIVQQIEIAGNTISGAHSSFKSRYPDNTYVDAYVERADHRRAVAWDDTVRRRRGAYRAA